MGFKGSSPSCLSLTLTKDDEKHSKQQQNQHIRMLSAESAVLFSASQAVGSQQGVSACQTFPNIVEKNSHPFFPKAACFPKSD